jgi:hypothetical protein
LAILMRSEHGENMTDRCDAEFVSVSEVKTVEAVDELCAIGHSHLLRMAIEKIERHPGENGIAQCGHLFEEVAGSGFRAGAVSRAPLVDDQFDAMRGVEFAHNLPVFVDQRFHAIAFAQQFVPINRIE